MFTEYHNELQKGLSYEAITKELFEKYESLYAVDVETSHYYCFRESDSFYHFNIEAQGNDFFKEAEKNALRLVYPDDRVFVVDMLSRNALIRGVEKDKYYTFVYRLMIDGEPVYHKLRATEAVVNNRLHILIGVRNIDKAYRLDMKRTEELAVLYSKEHNHLSAILASAEGYFEANLSEDSIVEMSSYDFPWGVPKDVVFPEVNAQRSYTRFEQWWADNLIVGNREGYIRISEKEYLISCFKSGSRRASVSFSMRAGNGQIRQCRKVFYLYQNNTSKAILAFCVLYDLTEQQQREKALKSLEDELRLSEIRNVTGQIQPHFLYNALSSIQEIILEEPVYAARLLGDFIIHLRSCLQAMVNTDPIPFDEELSNIKAYCNIEKMRFGEKLKIVYDIQVMDFPVLPFSVQPIVENAIRHGIYERGDKGGSVIVQTAEKSDLWLVSVKDDGVGFNTDMFQRDTSNAKSESMGLKNIVYRLEKILNASVEIKSTINIGTIVTIKIPKGRKE